MPNIIHPLTDMKGEVPLDLDTFLPKHVADQLAVLMNEMRPIAQRINDGENPGDAAVKRYGQLGQQAVKLLTDFLASPDCTMNPMRAATLIAKGHRISAVAKAIEDGASGRAGELLA